MIPLDKIIIGKEYVDLVLSQIGNEIYIVKIIDINYKKEKIKLDFGDNDNEEDMWNVFDAEDFQEIEDYKVEHL